MERLYSMYENQRLADFFKTISNSLLIINFMIILYIPDSYYILSINVMINDK